MILFRLAMWAEERKRLTEAISELSRDPDNDPGDTLFLRKKRGQLDEELLKWMSGQCGGDKSLREAFAPPRDRETEESEAAGQR